MSRQKGFLELDLVLGELAKVWEMGFVVQIASKKKEILV